MQSAKSNAVPWCEQTLLIRTTIYNCARCEYSIEKYRAFSNIPFFPYLCKICWQELSEEMKKLYIKVEKYNEFET